MRSCRSSAHTIRAILAASATTTTLGCDRESRARSQAPSRVSPLLSVGIAARAPCSLRLLSVNDVHHLSLDFFVYCIQAIVIVYGTKTIYHVHGSFDFSGQINSDKLGVDRKCHFAVGIIRLVARGRYT